MRKWITAVLIMSPFYIMAHQPDHRNVDTPIQKKPADTLVIKQFDGTTLHIVCDGNTYESYCETTDGYTVVLDKIGMYEYARTARGGDLVPNGSPAKDEDQRTAKEKRALQGTKKHLRYSGKKLEKIKEIEKKANDEPAIIKRYKHR